MGLRFSLTKHLAVSKRVSPPKNYPFLGIAPDKLCTNMNKAERVESWWFLEKRNMENKVSFGDDGKLEESALKSQKRCDS